MNDDRDPRDALLTELVDRPEIHAAAILDDHGDVRRREGVSHAIRPVSSDDVSHDDERPPTSASATEDVYLESLRDEMLAVAFDADGDLETIQDIVQTCRREWEET